MNLFTHYTQTYVNRRCRRAYQTYGECAKYYRYYRLSWERFQKTADMAAQMHLLFGCPVIDSDSPTMQITITPTVSDV